MKWTCLIAVFLSIVSAEEITNLPGIDWNLNFKHHNGYFQVSDTHHFHYWFVESQNSPENDPLIFWFTGGPGCSSIDGLLNEMGPFVVSKDGKKLIKNEFSWNKFASVVYIESPAGVGYSYATDGNITTNDEQTSLENYEAVKQFFQTFPDFRSHETFITGGSYCGVYVPTLAARIVDGQDDFPINLKGIAVENGYLSEVIFHRTAVRFAYEHGLLAENIWNTLENECCNGCVDTCDFSQFTGHCNTTVRDVTDNLIWYSGINPFDIYSDCEETESVDVPCSDNSNINAYMNVPEVPEALNIPPNFGKWDVCSADVLNNYKWESPEMAPYVKKIISVGVPVLLFYGDTDNFMMGQQFAQNLGLNRTIDKSPWKVEGSSQVAGFKTVYDGLTFITVKAGGHAPAQYRRPQTYSAVKQFLMNQPI